MEAFGPCLPNNRAGGDFIRFVYLHVEVDALADADIQVVVDVGVVVVVDIDVDLPPLQLNNVFGQMWILLQMLMFMLICLPLVKKWRI